jgi:hypothetical protein
MSAPPVVRKLGWYELALSAFSAFALIMGGLNGLLHWWHIPLFAISVLLVIGLLGEKRWAGVAAVVLAGLWLAFYLVIAVIILVRTEDSWPISLLFTLFNAAIASPPLLLLAEGNRPWLLGREPAELPT